jgi:predicted TIM-barrel fold metal-dependent hydrolase
VRIIGSHGGGTIPFLAGRLDAGWRSDPKLADRMPTPPSAVIDRLFLDAVLYHPRALQAAADLVGVGHLMFGTDHPFSISDPQMNIESIREAFSEPDALRVLAGAAIVLYET